MLVYARTINHSKRRHTNQTSVVVEGDLLVDVMVETVVIVVEVGPATRPLTSEIRNWRESESCGVIASQAKSRSFPRAVRCCSHVGGFLPQLTMYERDCHGVAKDPPLLDAAKALQVGVG